MALKLLSASKNKPDIWTTLSRKEPSKKSRNFATKHKQASKEDTCPDRACKKKRSIWNLFKRKKPEKKPEHPPIETCKKYLDKKRWEPDPDLSEFGGSPYRTCGPAYIIQKDKLPKENPCVEPESKILERIERHPDLKNVEDPMPPFESVEQRLIDLSEKKLHPLYKTYLSLPKRKQNLNYPKFVYKSRSGPISSDEVPSHLRINKHCLEQKNIYSEFKRVEPPRQLLAKMVEMRQNERPTLGKKEACPCEDQPKDVDVSKVMNTK